jgi:hypothetical protein
MLPLKEWQGILFAYGVLLILAETELGPLASLMAWGLAVTYFVDANVTQGNLIASLFTVNGPGSGPSVRTPAEQIPNTPAGAPPGTVTYPTPQPTVPYGGP